MVGTAASTTRNSKSLMWTAVTSAQLCENKQMKGSCVVVMAVPACGQLCLLFLPAGGLARTAADVPTRLLREAYPNEPPVYIAHLLDGYQGDLLKDEAGLSEGQEALHHATLVQSLCVHGYQDQIPKQSHGSCRHGSKRKQEKESLGWVLFGWSTGRHEQFDSKLLLEQSVTPQQDR